MGDGVTIWAKDDKANPSHEALWKASLDVLNFAPISISDQVGGLIVTDWYLDGKKRSKVSVRILKDKSEHETLDVSVFFEEFKNGSWVVIKEKNIQESEKIKSKILSRYQEIK